MYKFKDNKSGVYYHDQKFTLQWNFPDARWVVLKYVNGNKRVILPIVTNSNKQVVDGSKYKFLNFLLWLSRKRRRSYRYKRIFWRQGNDEFTNIANFRSQNVKVYIINSGIPWVKSIRIPLSVKLLRLEENKINVEMPTAHISPLEFKVMKAEAILKDLVLNVKNSELEVQLPVIDTLFDAKMLTPTCSYSINELINSRKISEETNNESILQLLN